MWLVGVESFSFAFRSSDSGTVMRTDQSRGLRRNYLQAWRQQFLDRRSRTLIFRTCALLGCKTCAQYYLSAGLEAAVSRSSVFLQNRRLQMQECSFRAAILGPFVQGSNLTLTLPNSKTHKGLFKMTQTFKTSSIIENLTYLNRKLHLGGRNL